MDQRRPSKPYIIHHHNRLSFTAHPAASHAPSFEDESNRLNAAPKFEQVSWWREPHLRKLYAACCVLMLASVTTGYDGMLINTSQMIGEWDRYFDFQPNVVDDTRLAVMVNLFNVGAVLSFFVTPYIADNHGRKTAIMAGCVIMMGGACLMGFCSGYGMYVAGRFFLGFGNSLAQMASPLLLTEICHPQHRAPVTTVYNCLWNLGAIVVSCLGWGTSRIQSEWAWRSITLATIGLSLIQLTLIWFVPESPRYLISKGRNAEALHTLSHWHAGGDNYNATVQYEFLEIKETLRAEKENRHATSYRDFVRTSGNLWRLAILVSLGIISQYSGNAMFSNYIDTVYEGAGITAENTKLALATGQRILDLLVTVTAALNVNRFGRRPMFLVSTAGMVVSCAMWTTTSWVYEASGYTNEAAGIAQLVFIWIFQIFYDIGFAGLLVAYALEVLPFHLRAKGMMIMFVSMQAALALANQTNKIAWDTLPAHWNFMLFYTCWDFVEMLFVWYFYVETKGPTLEEIARIFDGDDAVAHIDLDELEKDLRERRRDGRSWDEIAHPGIRRRDLGEVG